MTKFLFENNFDVDQDGNLKPDETPDAIYSEEDLAAARGEAQAIGFAAGKQEALGGIENLVANTLQNITAAVGNIGAQYEQAVLAVKAESAQMAMVIAGKLAPSLLERQPMDEIQGLILECLELLPTEPRIVVRVSEPILEQLSEEIDQLAIRAGFQGSVVLLAEDNMTGADCRVEWADGGAERNIEALFQKIDSAVGRYCANLNDQIKQIDEAEQAAAQASGLHDMDLDNSGPEHDQPRVEVLAPPEDENPFPLPPGTEDFGVVDDPLPPLARAASQVPPLPNNGNGTDEMPAQAPTITEEP
ncbi:MAG: hypothetical protein HN834_03530 [Rhodospirillaceae bacterium]|nr:hypothetical protein [Rhodospirillaceae bacterium]MBT5881241.1 hypothetical protein [Rhodospirillaceae bacterium]MBT7284503.1 hypothetical protein [Rhodospirillaceae bacterium]